MCQILYAVHLCFRRQRTADGQGEVASHNVQTNARRRYGGNIAYAAYCSHVGEEAGHLLHKAVVSSRVLMKISIDSLSLSLSIPLLLRRLKLSMCSGSVLATRVKCRCFFTGRRMLLFVLTLTAGHQQAGLSP
jgi:hypothetical protein